MTNFLKELSKNKENYFCMAVIILLLVYLFCNTCNKENLVIKGSSNNTNLSQVLGLNSNNEIVLSEQLSNVGAAVPIGTILMWSPTTVNKNSANIPSGWFKCDGKNYKVPLSDGSQKTFTTPNLTGRFIKGVGGYDPQGNLDVLGQNVNKASYKLKDSDLPEHEHIYGNNLKCSGNSCPLVNQGAVQPPSSASSSAWMYTKPQTLGMVDSTGKTLKTQTSFKVSDPDYYVVIYIIKLH